MTAIIFYSGFIGVYGFIIGKSFKKLNPFLMLLGMFFTLPVIMQVEQNNQPLLYIPFGIGFFANFGNPFRRVLDFFAGIKMDIERYFANKRYKKEQKRREKERAKQQAKREKQAKQQAKQNKRNSANQNYQSQQNNFSEQQRQAQAERERLKREAEELRRQREQFQREQAQSRQNQTSQNNHSSNNDDLNPDNYADACEILGCDKNADFATLKKSYRYLRSMYHPDKVSQFSGRRKKQAEAEMKLINLAWDRVQKKFR